MSEKPTDSTTDSTIKPLKSIDDPLVSPFCTKSEEEICDVKSTKNPTISRIKEIWNDNIENIRIPNPKPQRVVDQYNKEEIGAHIQRFAQHCAAKGIQPTLDVIVDWLYGEKAFNERDDFVKIEKLMDMIGHGQVYPLLIMEVLDYASKVEKAAISVHDELGHLCKEFDSLQQLRDALDIRLSVREQEKNKEPSFITDLVSKMNKGANQ